MQAQRGVCVLGEVARFPAVVVGVEDEPARIGAAQEDHSDRGPSPCVSGAECRGGGVHAP